MNLCNLYFGYFYHNKLILKLVEMCWICQLAGSLRRKGSLNWTVTVWWPGMAMRLVGEWVVRDHCGGVYAYNLGTCSIPHAEFMGLKVAWSRGFTSLSMESDSKVTISRLEGQCDSRHGCYQLVQAIKEHTNRGGNYSWAHILREANQVADSTFFSWRGTYFRFSCLLMFSS